MLVYGTVSELGGEDVAPGDDRMCRRWARDLLHGLASCLCTRTRLSEWQQAHVCVLVDRTCRWTAGRQVLMAPSTMLRAAAAVRMCVLTCTVPRSVWIAAGLGS